MIRNLKDCGTEGATCEVASTTEPGKWYSLVRSSEASGAEWRCTCPRNFIKRQECRHIDEVITEVHRREMTADWEPRLWVVRFLSGGNDCEAVAIASGARDAENKVRARYGQSIRQVRVLATNNEVIITSGRRYV